MATSDERTGKVYWNIAAEQASFIHWQIVDANNHYKKGDIGSYFICLTGVRDNLHHELNDNEKKLLDDMEDECRRGYMAWSTYVSSKRHGENMSRETLEKKKEFTNLVRTYHRAIMDCLKRMGFMPDKEDRAKLRF